MTTETNIYTLARELADSFETKYHGDREWDALRDTAPAWAQLLVHAAHADMLPDDWRYQTIRDAAECIAEAGDYKESLDDVSLEFADGTDVYNHDLIAWLGSHPNRPGYCDAYAEEFSLPSAEPIMTRIGGGQYMERRDVFEIVRFELEKIAEEVGEDA